MGTHRIKGVSAHWDCNRIHPLLGKTDCSQVKSQLMDPALLETQNGSETAMDVTSGLKRSGEECDFGACVLLHQAS